VEVAAKGRSIGHVATQLRRVLVAEDDRAARGSIAAALRAAGWDVVEADDGMQLLRDIEREATEGQGPTSFVVIAGSRIPGLTGVDVLAALRCAYWKTAVILLTPARDDDTRAEAEELGAAAVLEGPLDLEMLHAAVRRAALPLGS
jgi:DNA-binding response OmpR family regulator